MRVLRERMQGDDVEAWQYFLTEVGQFIGSLDGDFGPKTTKATKGFQSQNGLAVDGAVGAQTLKRAMELGFDPFEWPDAPVGVKDPFFPPKPSNLKALSVSQAQALYGTFTWKRIPGEDRAIRITDGWESTHLTMAKIPQLAKIGKPASITREMHVRSVTKMQALWQAWEDANLIKLVRTFDGLRVARVIGGTNTLSNHAFGVAFDINATLNPWGTPPTAVGQPGSVRLLVPLANEHGFFWGGHYNGKKDGMHFELVEP
jgi:hypothetical protein